jgi:Ca-activated chloride channel family protein
MRMESLTFAAAVALYGAGVLFADATPVTEGSLLRIDPYSKNTGAACPLKHTDVQAEITGFLARVTVTQEFRNDSGQKIEAVYVFPLPAASAVDRMTMIVGDRKIHADIKRRDEARKIYENARNQGQVASLLEQERPNIFTQSVTNIEPGATVRIEISYVETLKYEEGAYEFSFPMVVGPRYIPGSPTGQQSSGWSPDTTKVPDASRITPKLAPQGVRAGHDISLTVKIDAGVPIDNLNTKTHEVVTTRPSPRQAVVTLADKASIPNKDFVLKYDVAGAKVQDAILTHRAQRGGFFTLILQPPERVTAEDVDPKELVFVLDTSGSMSGFPIEKAKETMRLALNGLYPRDTFNLITFSGDTHILFPHPVPATPDNLQQAQTFLAGRYGGGGTEMMKAIKAALDPSDDSGKIRIVCFMTDGYVGNDMEIIAEVKRHPNARVFSFGIGSSVNRFLLDKMASEGRGEVEYVGLNDDGSAAARRFHERVRNPLLTDISIDWGGLPVSDVYPRRIPDLFGAKPVIVNGRFDHSSSGVVRLHGRMSGRWIDRELRVKLPDNEPSHDVLATLWARTKIEDLMSQDWAGMQRGAPTGNLQEQITQLGLTYRLMTQFTSFVAVEDRTVTRGGQPVLVEVPVEMPEGVSHQGVFGDARQEMANFNGPNALRAAKSVGVVGGVPGGLSRVDVGGVAGGGQMPAAAPPPRIVSHIDQIRPLEEKDKERAKLNPVLEARVAANEQGKVLVEVWLAEATPAALEKLKQLGFKPDGEVRVAKIRRGWIEIARLRDLIALSDVLAVNPVK